jgi:hypothetical protein
MFLATMSTSTRGAGTWTGSGPGTATVVSDGSIHNPQFQYYFQYSDPSDLNRPGQTWDFHTRADADGAVTLPYCWRGFHAFYSVTAHLQAYVTHLGVTTFTSLVDSGLAFCCLPPSGGFHYTGTVTLDVQTGDTYGFQFGGSNDDGDTRLLGTFSAFSTTPPTCNAGGPYYVAVGATSIQLNGTGSSDPDNDPLTYKWTTDCPNATFDDPTSATPVLTFSQGGVCNQQCRVTLTVDDGCDSSTCSATVTFVVINLSIYSGFVPAGGGAPYSGLVGSFVSGDVMFATDTGYDWHPFGLDEFGADITGYLNVAANGTYTFTLDSDEGSLLFIDGNLVVNNGDPHDQATATGDASLMGGLHCFEVQFFKCCGGSSGVDLILPAGVTYACPTCKLVCPNDITGVCKESGTCRATVSYSAPTTTGDCNVVGITCTPASGSSFPAGSTTVTCAANDACGRTVDRCSFTVTVNDCEAPTINCPDVVTQCNETGICGAHVTFSPTTDNCPGSVTTSCTPASGSLFPIGTTAVICTATDASGNSASCTFKVIVTVCSTKCPLGTGFWKSHASLWPVTSLTLGTVTYSQAQLLAILKLSPGSGTKADASLILAQQLIAAKLNLANGASPCPIASTVAAADALIGGRRIPIVPKITPPTAEGNQMVSLAGPLGQYNTGLLTPGCTP